MIVKLGKLPIKRPKQKSKAVRYDIPQNRRKERPLSDIIAKVTLWRKYYTGVVEEDENGEKCVREYSLHEAANKIGISKKSLDDYLL